MTLKHHILLLGGTGSCGQIMIKAILEAGHQLTLYVRSPGKLPENQRANPLVTVVEGTLEDKEALNKVALCGADVFISVAGPTMGKKDGTPISNGFKILYPALLAAKPSVRIMVLSTPSHSDPKDGRSLKWWLVVTMVKLLGGDTFKEAFNMAASTVALGDKVEWTVFRVPALKGETLDENPGGVNAGYLGDGKDGLELDRGRMARWVLNEIDEKKWIQASPVISNQ